MNNLKTVALLGLMSALVWVIAQALIGGTQGLIVGFLLAAGLNFFAYFFSDKVAIAAARAVPVPPDQMPELHEMIGRLASDAGIPTPRLYFIDSPQPNAFATGRNPKHAVVAVTSGILATLNRDELEGVLAHELGHVQNRDILISSIAAMLAAALSIFARMSLFGGRRRNAGPVEMILGLVSIIVAPLAAMVLKTAISRAREFEADATGADLTGRPLHLASALAKISAGAQRHPMRVNAAVSQLFIADPLQAFNARQSIGRLFSTHPPVEARIERLRQMASGPVR